MEVGGFVEPKDGFDFFKYSGARLSEDDISRDDECHLGAGVRSAVESELATDSVRPLAHSP